MPKEKTKGEIKNKSMKKKIHIYFYIAAAVFAALFAIFTLIAWLGYKELISNPLVHIAPFGKIAKRLACIFLSPALICLVTGVLLKKKSKSKEKEL